MTQPFGIKGCSCWPDDETGSGWYPNAWCVHHGLLSGFTERKDTGAYRVVPKAAREPSRPPGGDCVMDGTWGPHEHVPQSPGRACYIPAAPRPAVDPGDCCGDCQYCRTTTEEEKPCSSVNPPGRKSLGTLFRGLRKLLN